MKISYSWLQDHIEFTTPAEEVGKLLTGGGLEVEGIETFERVKGGLKGVVIGKVLTCERIPETDKLKKTTVDVGNGIILPVVCGAPNVAAGQKVLVATEGTVLYPNGSDQELKIKKGKIKGEPSHGMICAEDELGLGVSHDGILVLDTQLPEGTDAAVYFDLGSDQVYEIGLTPNRADAASHYGVARDLQALLRKPVKTPDSTPLQHDNESAVVKVSVENTEAAPRYCGVTISGIKVAPSPTWLQNKLRAIGLNPINNVVDITNYILHDLGQPLHAFDLAKVKGNSIIVKTVAEGTEFTTLDGVKRKLKSNDLMICNSEEPMCIAGVFGGLDSGVSDSTTAIFLESAYFDATYVRKTGTQHGLKTDSSFRFERGTDPNMPLIALKKAALLIKEIAGGTISSKVTDLYPAPVKDFIVSTTYSRIHQLIGKEIEKEKIKEILKDLQIKLVEEKGDTLTLQVPPFKVDVKTEADIVEEVLRIYGYDNIELSQHLNSNFLASFPEKDAEKLIKTVSLLLADNGFNEILTNSLTSPAYAEKMGVQETSVHILNKLSEELGVMRQRLIFSGLEVVAHNINRRQSDLKLFEFGKTYEKREGKYSEKNHLALYITGNIAAESWQQPLKATDYPYAHAVVQKVLTRIGINGLSPQLSDDPAFEQSYAFKRGEKQIAVFGAVKGDYLQLAGIKQPVFYIEFNLEYILRTYSSGLNYKDFSRFPEVRRDLSLVLDKKVTFEEISKVARKVEKKLLSDMNVFDVYEGKNIGEGKKSYSISFTLVDAEQTLTDKVIDSTMDKLMKALETDLGAVIRK